MNTIDLTPFCSVDETRMAINTPFVLNGWKYATDGRVCVRIKTYEPDDSNEPYKRPKASDLFKGFNVGGLESFEIPDLKGVEMLECDECNGAGSVTCNYGHEHECDMCEGGTVEKWSNQHIGPATFSERYLVKIKALPSLKFFPTKSDAPAFFTFNGGEGIIATVRAS
jgi:hypothetical protein